MQKRAMNQRNMAVHDMWTVFTERGEDLTDVFGHVFTLLKKRKQSYWDE